MNKLVHSFCMVVLLILVSSCIKDDYSDCPAQYVVKVSVKDKNYFNVSQFPQLARVDETLPFNNFSGNIYYTLRNVATGAVQQESSIMPVIGNDRDYSIAFDEIPAGEYVLTIWGNLTSDYPAGVLHKDGKEHTDIYLASRRLSFSSKPQTTEMTLERTKGKLVLFCTNFPASVTRVEEDILPVYQSVDENFSYSGSGPISKSATVQPIVETLLAPSVAGNTAKLNLRFYTADTRAGSEPYLTLPEMDLTVRRNEITAMLIDHNTAAGVLEIWNYIDGAWTMIHRLDIK